MCCLASLDVAAIVEKLGCSFTEDVRAFSPWNLLKAWLDVETVLELTAVQDQIGPKITRLASSTPAGRRLVEAD